MKITYTRIREILSYDPETGILINKISRTRKAKAGKRAGSPTEDGYRQIMIDKMKFKEHRIIYFWMTGHMPEGQIDHKNLIKNDNRWENLRIANNSLNQANRVKNIRAKSTSHKKGVSMRGNKWTASIHVNGRCIYLGTFSDQNEANEAYKIAALKYFGEFARW